MHFILCSSFILNSRISWMLEICLANEQRYGYSPWAKGGYCYYSTTRQGLVKNRKPFLKAIHICVFSKSHRSFLQKWCIDWVESKLVWWKMTWLWHLASLPTAAHRRQIILGLGGPVCHTHACNTYPIPKWPRHLKSISISLIPQPAPT